MSKVLAFNSILDLPVATAPQHRATSTTKPANIADSVSVEFAKYTETVGAEALPFKEWHDTKAPPHMFCNFCIGHE